MGEDRGQLLSQSFELNCCFASRWGPGVQALKHRSIARFGTSSRETAVVRSTSTRGNSLRGSGHPAADVPHAA